MQEEPKRSSAGKDGNGKRRGVWKRVRVRPLDSFETAESQNIGKQLYNSLVNDQSHIEEFGTRYNKRVKEFGVKPPTYSEPQTFPQADDLMKEALTTFPSFIAPVSEEQSPVTTESPRVNDDVIATTVIIDNAEVTTFTPEATTIATSAWNVDAPEVTTELNERNTAIPTEISADADVQSEIKTEPTIDSSTAASIDSKMDTSAEDTNESKDDEGVQDQTQSSSVIDEVKKRLTELFSFEDDDVMVSTTERVFRINRNFNRPKGNVPKGNVPHYTTIDRNHAVNEILSERNKDEENDKSIASPATMKLEPVTALKTILRPVTEASSFHKDLMDSVIYATSTSTEISHETEICYRGRCVKTLKKP